MGSGTIPNHHRLCEFRFRVTLPVKCNSLRRITMILSTITRIRVQWLPVVLILAYAINIAGATADVDPTFNPILTNTLTGNYEGDAVLQPDGKWILFGTYTGGRFIQRINPDGTVDPTFDCPACLSAPPLTAAVQADGKILISLSGKFIRVHANGSMDTTFRTNYKSVKFISSLADGKSMILYLVPEGGTG